MPNASFGIENEMEGHYKKMNKEGWGGGWRGPWKTELLLMNMHIHIWTLVGVKDNGDWEVCWPLWAYSASSHTKTQIFRWGLVRDGVEGSSSTPECPWIRQTGSGPARTPVPTAIPMNSHNSTGPLVGYLFSDAPPCSPWMRPIKGREGVGERNERDGKKNHNSFTVTTWPR